MEQMTGDPVFCSACRAILNASSTVTPTNAGQIWNCEFCGVVNSVSLEDAEIPKKPTLDYVLSLPAGKMQAKTLFLIDVSGSMYALAGCFGL